MSERRQSLVETELPNKLIHSVGVYVQLCARIEKLVVEAIIVVEKLEEPEASQQFAELSLLPTSELISSLRRITESLPPDHPWYPFFTELRPYLYQFVSNRHKAVHGVLSSIDTLQVRYFDRKSKKIALDEFSQNDVDEMLEHADNIARALHRFCDEI
ncbi:hypothetical protein [uncultured Roseovarius sp.]|uniref:hypothetical protein n=1 Tax=uncultured Roseovarius sp. TaxID=293344 RepID=UPI0025977920|nr:hypothetical protein [uncultured Roseovarius sp.]